MKSFQSKTVLITGASSGIGEAFSNQFAEAGANLVLVARSEDVLQNLSKTLQEKFSIQCHVIALDLSKENAAKELFDRTNSLNLEIDILVNNAGFGKIGDFEEYDLETYHSLLHLNINTLTELCWLYLPSMKKKNSGGIINVASTASFLPIPYSAVYSASKSYVLHFSESLFGELLETKVTVTCLCPSRTKTNFAKVANSKFPNYESKSYDTAENSAKVGIDAFLKGKNTVISGPQKLLVSLLPRIFSRSRVIKLASKEFKK
jgi:short-subunit dehydrogenase